ncbi:pirin family protein [Shewanella pealeana]|uniref:Pirin domain protein n=1 Tax=Shewanella pealeana (strain ATCC 700345 / ANG-SQ1) TaxID=398579 RepID=A8H1R2_SHEPA|nr:pirin-like bicupin family protein [Shewanella pealeana]ABV86499.1 Pirin domain protein [Shewanella pealeana ATCC 700345]
MIKHYPYNRLGHANHGWLKSKHHFSFANYYNPTRMGFGKLRVVNDDWVEAGTGFASHPHRNMEIISFIRSGAITHQDSTGNIGITEAGEVQVMSAGKGIVHSEYNRTKDPLTLYQIWIETNKQNVEPRWESKKFPTQQTEELTLLASGYSEDTSKTDTEADGKKDSQALFINQEARIYGGKLAKGTVIEHNINHQAYILASNGMFDIEDASATGSQIDNITMNKGDGAEVTQSKSINLSATTDCEIIIIDTIE